MTDQERIRFDGIYQIMQPGIFSNAMKLAKGRMVGQDWAGDSILLMIDLFEKYKDLVSDDTKLIKIIGKIVSLRLISFYRREKRIVVTDTLPEIPVREDGFSSAEFQILVDKISTLFEGKCKDFFIKKVFSDDDESDSNICKELGISKATGSRIKATIINTINSILNEED